MGLNLPNIFDAGFSFNPNAGSGSVSVTQGARMRPAQRMSYKAAWSASVNYIKDQIVTLDGITYVCTIPNKNNTPPNASYWDIIAHGNVKSDEYVVDAAGNGDYTTIGAALTALGSSAGTIRVKAGTYTITATLTFGGTNQSIVGSGWGTKIETSTGLGYMIDDNGETRCEVQNLKMDGKDTAGVTGCIRMSGEYGRVIDCWLEDAAYGVVMTGARGTISLCHITSNTNDGIIISSPNFIVSNCQIKSNADTGIVCSGSGGVIVGNDIELNYSYGVHIGGTDDITIAGNIIRSNGTAPNDPSVFLYNADNNVIVGNVIKQGDDYSVEVEGATCSLNTIVGNYLGCASGQVNDKGTTTLIAHNSG